MRHILSNIAPGLCAITVILAAGYAQATPPDQIGRHDYNGDYTGEYLDRIAFPIGGIGAGMVCLEGTGAISHVSVRHRMQFFNEPCSFAAICVRRSGGNTARILEGPVPRWKVFGGADSGNGSANKTYGLPRFQEATFLAHFPFASVTLHDPDIPLEVELTGWSPFLPGQADDSSLPVGALEYRFKNTGAATVEAVFSYNTKNFMAEGGSEDAILPTNHGFILWQAGVKKHPEYEGGFAVFVADDTAVVDHCWFKGGWWDAVTLAWRNVQKGKLTANPAQPNSCPGASLSVPLELAPGQERTISVMLAWYVPETTLRLGRDPAGPAFGPAGPSHGTGPQQQEVTGFIGQGLVNTFDASGDGAIGTLTSPQFELTQPYIQFLIGGGNHPDTTCVQLLVGDKVVQTATGKNDERLRWKTWDVSSWKGQRARIRILDQEGGAWGHINVDQIVLTKRRWPNAAELMRNKADWGNTVTVLNDFEGPDWGGWVAEGPAPPPTTKPGTPEHHVPWYAGRFKSIDEVAAYWRENYDRLRRESVLFRDAFYDTTLPPEVVEAVAANLTILKSPTVLRQTDGRLWCFEGCSDNEGCCHGSCTHVWNYAQAVCHLFPDLERSLRETEFRDCQDERGHQTFRACLPIRPPAHNFHAASDGQLGGIMKVYREWRISGDGEWLRAMWPQVRQSLDYCIKTWDPRQHGVLEEPHHNTYDIEYWGPDGHCSSFYLGALTAAIEMGSFLGEDTAAYRTLLDRGREFLEGKLHNGEYFFQIVQTDGLTAKYRALDESANGPGYDQTIATLNKQGPKYQYGTGCLSDGVLGFWMARACGLDREIVDTAKVRSNLSAIHRHNLRSDLSDHANPQRPSYAVGHEGGLLLCTWPRGGAPALPFVYSDEVWTGIEYHVASHLMMEGMVPQGLEIVRICRDRYNGRVRNPFDEYECGHWYARALSSYALLQGLTGARYDAVEKTLYIDSRVGDSFRSFLSTATGYGTVGLVRGRPFLDVKHGRIEVVKVIVSGRPTKLKMTD
ncbi:MAG TPA: GH116 family glycosyl hydrolase [Phycisphaerae bacterium]|nr:GH116 family glycosyl hydrolase [Phycisphaerae bacterium]